MTAFDAIGKHVLPTKTWNPVATAPAQLIDYIDLSAIDSNSKQISDVKQVLGKDAPSRARQLVKVADVLVSTVRPNLNGLAIVPEKLDGATASTGFTVLRANETSLAARYLYHWLKTPEFISDMVKKATGQSYPAVSDRIVLESLMPLPKIEEQRRIATILDQAEALRAKRRQALAKLDTLAQSLFLEMFGDPTSKKSIWPVHQIGELDLHISDGNYSSKYPTSAEFVDVGIPFIRANNIQDLTLRDDDLRFITLEKHRELKKGHLIEDDVLITTRGEIGKIAIVPSTFQGANINAQIVLLRPTSRQINSCYLAHLLSSQQMKNRFKGYQNGVALQQLPIHSLTRVPLPIPPPELQSLFASRMMPIENLRLSNTASLIGMDSVLTSLQQRAFRGEL